MTTTIKTIDTIHATLRSAIASRQPVPYWQRAWELTIANTVADLFEAVIRTHAGCEACVLHSLAVARKAFADAGFSGRLCDIAYGMYYQWTDSESSADDMWRLAIRTSNALGESTIRRRA